MTIYSRLQSESRQRLGDLLGQSLIGQPDEHERQEINKFRERFLSIEFALRDVAGETEKTWVRHQQVVKDNILSGDPRRFLSWPHIKYAMSVS